MIIAGAEIGWQIATQENDMKKHVSVSTSSKRDIKTSILTIRIKKGVLDITPEKFKIY